MAENGKRRFSLRNLSFRREKRQTARPRSSIDLSHSQTEPKVTGSKVTRSLSVRSSSARPARPEQGPTREPRLTTHNRTARQGNWNSNDAWNKPVIGRALKPFTAILRCDLTFETGDQILILTQTSKQFDWWEGTVRGETGIFPANFIQLVD